MTHSGSSRVRFRMAVAAVALGMCLVSVSRPFHAQSAGSAPSGPFAGGVVNHFGVIVEDVDRVVAAYGELFGVTPPAPREFKGILFTDDFSGDRDAHPKFSMMQLGGSGMEVMNPVGGVSPWRAFLEKHGPGMQHITFTVKNAVDAVAHLKKLGGQHELGAVKGVGYAYVNFRDQLGFTLELGQPSASGITLPPGPSATPSSIGTSPVRHIGIVVPNVQKAAALFSQALGMAAPAVQTSTDTKIKTVVFPLNVGIAFIEPTGGGTPWAEHLKKYGPSIHHVAIAVDDMKKYSSFLREKGGKASKGTTPDSTFFELRPSYAVGIELSRR